MSAVDRVGRVCDAASRLLADDRRAALLAMRMARASRWSVPMADWILRATLQPLTDAASVGRWYAGSVPPGEYEGTTIVVAGGPVPDPAVRSLAAAALLGGPAHLKVAAAEPVLAPAFAEALRENGGLDVEVHDFRRGVGQQEAALYGTADRILAFGRQPALDAIEQLAGDGCLFLGHGPRMSLALVLDPWDDEGLTGLALDIARYDQRGCLSPQMVLVAGGEPEGARVVERLGVELEVLSGVLPPGVGALGDELAWRLRVDRVLLEAIAADDSHAFHTDGETYMVYASHESNLELSPGGRVVSVVADQDVRAAALDRIGSAAGHVQGVAIVGEEPGGWEGFLGAHHVAAAGHLQTPPLELRPDGHDPFATP